MVPQVQIIGLDGCDPILLTKWMEEGLLPTFSEIVENGFSMPLRSTIPPTTFPAWITMFTGKTPGKLGVFDFFDLKQTESGFSQKLYTTNRWAGDYIWDIAGQHGKKCGIINIPFFTPSRVNGYMLDLHMSSSYPSTFLEDLTRTLELPKHFNPEISPTKKGEIQRIKKNTLLEFKIGKILQEKDNTDLFIQVFNILDSTAHCTSDIKLLRDRYMLIDQLLSKHFEYENKNTLFVSDHGMKKVKKRFYVNKCLIDMGFLTLRDEFRSNSFSPVKRFIYDFLDVFPSFEFMFEDILSRIKKKNSPSILNTEKVDWGKSIAYSHSSNATGYAGIWLTEEGLQKKAQILNEFEKLKSLNAKNILKEIYLPDEIYNGPFLNSLPHIILELVDDMLAMSSFSPIQSRSTNSFSHASDGIIIAYGPDIPKKKETEKTHISNVAPTVLRLLELPIPDYMDGKAIQTADKTIEKG
jgi:predicted AlkP superfamily phosphohydrolase/phosphomutase